MKRMEKQIPFIFPDEDNVTPWKLFTSLQRKLSEYPVTAHLHNFLQSLPYQPNTMFQNMA